MREDMVAGGGGDVAKRPHGVVAHILILIATRTLALASASGAGGSELRSTEYRTGARIRYVFCPYRSI